MRFTGCDEFRSLRMQHEYARRRVWRYSHPEADPVLSIAGATPSEHIRAAARVEELELSRRLEAHQETCEACREVQNQVAM
jgi:hypothetical protein